jgi:hypothetical protein
MHRQSALDMILGAVGTVGSFLLHDINTFFSITAGAATTIYMGFCIHEKWTKRKKK